MTVQAGARLGPYEIVAPLGAIGARSGDSDDFEAQPRNMV